LNSAHIRNFSIVAHIDHGKSTLADRMIERAGALQARELRDQVLDSMDLERERGITIKASTVRLAYRSRSGEDYALNLIDTPGHVDFGYEVSRSMRAVEGSLLVVDASQGVEAQTLANAYLAIDAGHEILPVLNKIDLPAAEPDRVATEIEDMVGVGASDALRISAKNGDGVDALLEAVIEQVPPPAGDPGAPLKALLVDSWYDSYLGVVVLVRVFDGELCKNMQVELLSTGTRHQLDRVGVFAPKMRLTDRLGAGEIGFFTASIKTVATTRVGDTVTEAKRPCAAPLAGFRPAQPVVFCGLYPMEGEAFGALRDAIDKLSLNDSSFVHEPESSAGLGMGFRCGFLGLLHLEIVCERLEREFGVELVATAPSVIYRVTTADGIVVDVHNPKDLPPPERRRLVEEPWIRATVITPPDHLGDVMALCRDRRGVQHDLAWSGARAIVSFDLPLNEVVLDFYDRLKSVTRGFASFDHQLLGYRQGDLQSMTILVNGEPVDALAGIVHRSQAERRGRSVCERLKGLIPRQLFKIPIQAAAGGRILARETVPALRKDVTAKCYGGDVSRKRKLLDKQKEGKKRMRQVGRVDIPKDAFVQALRIDR